MCGIVGYIGHSDAVPVLAEGLRRLEYRGYDSAGLAVLRRGRLEVHKSAGKVATVLDKLPKRFKGPIGIGHTRWATHGAPTDANAHPHTEPDGRVAVVHNGIVENARELRAGLACRGATFTSETDTELLAHLIAEAAGESLADKVRTALAAVTGAYGLAVIAADHPDELVVARNGSAVILGVGDKEMFVASDAQALVRHTEQVVYLEDGDVASLSAEGYRIVTLDARPADKPPVRLAIGDYAPGKDGHAHFMLKEIHEQPEVLRQTVRGRIERRFATARLDGLELTPRELLAFRRIKIIGCGSALIAGTLGARLLERATRLPSDAESAAELRYRNPVIEQDTLYLAVSQSGETFDTLAAVEEIRRKGGIVAGIVNVVGSSIARACGRGIYLHAGPEVSVVSTKTFAATLMAFALLALHIGRMRDLSVADGERLIAAIDRLPERLGGVLAADYAAVGKRVAGFEHAYFVGRNDGFALAMEGALKLKEVSYIHAEAYPASELKHGPLALVDPETLCVVLAPGDELLNKNLGTIEEIRARSGPVLALGHDPMLAEVADDAVIVPAAHPWLDALTMLVPLQLIAYHAALARGCDVDQPRNLAKSVTVE